MSNEVKTFEQKLDEWYGNYRYEAILITKDDFASLYLVEAPHEIQLVRLFRIGNTIQISIDEKFDKEESMLGNMAKLAEVMYQANYNKLL